MSTRRRRPRAGSDGPVPGTAAELTPDADPASVARAILLRQLTMGPRTRAQLAAALARREVSQDVAEQVLDRFEEVDLIDDAEFARQWVQTRHAGRGLARRALSHELRHRGVDDDTVRQAVGELDHDAELATARELVRRRLPGMAGDDPARRTRRLAAMLARKGYPAGTAFQAIREVLAAAGDPTNPADDDGMDALSADLD